MKKTSKLFKLAIMLAVGCVAIATLEVFDFHPQFHVGKYHSYWLGVRKMDFSSSGSMVIPLTTGKTQIYQEYNFLLFSVVGIEEV